MVIELTEQSTLLEIFKSQNLGATSALQLVQFLAHLEKHKGILFVCNYLKGVRSYLLKGEKSDHRIAVTAKGSLIGPMRPISRLWESGRKGRIRADRILRVYGRWEHPEPTAADYQKFAASVAGTSISAYKLAIQLTLPELRAGTCAARDAKFDFTLPNSTDKKTPLVGKRESETLPFEHYRVLSEYAPGILIRNGDLFNLLYPLYFAENSTAYSFSAADEATTYKNNRVERAMGSNKGYTLSELSQDIVGTVVGLTKDRGYKLRFIANPHRFIQLALSRLKHAFEIVLRQMPESSVYDQGSGISWAQSKLLEGNRLWSVDLSAATDNFPFSFQESVARQLFGDALEPDINLWRDVVHSSWTTPVPLYPNELTGIRSLDYPTVFYGRGQPMGVAPSFAAFTVSHISLLRALGGNQNTFRVLGDDVLIADEDLYKRYRLGLDLLNVPISPSKSLFGAKLGEFAGRLVDQIGPWPVYKASKLSIRSDPLGLVRQYGKRILKGKLPLGRFKKEVINFFSSLPGYGFQHSLDGDVFRSLSIDQLAILYPEKQLDPLPLGSKRPVVQYALSGITPIQPIFEPGHRMLGFLGELPNTNNKVVVEHLNINASDLDSKMIPEIRELWLKGVERNPDSIRAWAEEPSLPFSLLKRIYKRAMHV
jgi:hypothetical protein